MQLPPSPGAGAGVLGHASVGPAPRGPILTPPLLLLLHPPPPCSGSQALQVDIRTRHAVQKHLQAKR